MNQSSGFIYILINPSLDGIVKIGKTQRDPAERAKEISQATGVATPFYLAYSIPFNDIDSVERQLHAILEQGGFRVSQNREFFRISLESAIKLLHDIPDNPLIESLGNDLPVNFDYTGRQYHPGFELFQQGQAAWFGYDDAIQDILEGIRLIEQSMLFDFPAAYTSLAEYYFDWKTPPDRDRGIAILREGAAHGHGRCYVDLAFFYRKEGHIDNFQKCWSRYFNSLTFINDNDMVYTEGLIVGAGFSRIRYIRLYLCLCRKFNIDIPSQIMNVIRPYFQQTIDALHRSIKFHDSMDDSPTVRDARSEDVELLSYITVSQNA